MLPPDAHMGTPPPRAAAVPARGVAVPVLGKATIDPGVARALTGHMPVSGAVHPAVAAKWMSSPEPASSSVAAKPHLHSTNPAAAEPVTEREVGGKLVALQTATQAARVLIVDDQTLFRSGLAGLLNQDRRVHGVGEAGDGADAGKQAGAPQPRAGLAGVQVPELDGVGATPRVGR